MWAALVRRALCSPLPRCSSLELVHWTNSSAARTGPHPLEKGRCSPRCDHHEGVCLRSVSFGRPVDGVAACCCFPAVALLFSCCCYYCCGCWFLELVEDVVRFGRLSRIAVTLGGRVRRLRSKESRDEGHEHRKGVQHRCDPVITERGVTSPVCAALCSSHGRHCTAGSGPLRKSSCFLRGGFLGRGAESFGVAERYLAEKSLAESSKP